MDSKYQSLLSPSQSVEPIARPINEMKGEDYYTQEEEALRESTDRTFGITRTLVKSDQYPTGYAVHRDATGAREISDPDSGMDVESNNVKLRVLGRLRGIDYVLRQKMAEPDADQKELYAKLIAELKTEYDEFALEVDTNEVILFERLERTFNTVLCRILHAANLDEGCKTQEDYQKLLFHYRNLSALLTPAHSLVTVSYDKDNKVLHRITQHPIAKKTMRQQQDILADMKKVCLAPTGEELSFQTKQPICMQVANSYFAELAASDDRVLPSQTRKTHLHSLKNAFFVKNELLFLEKDDFENNLPKTKLLFNSKAMSDNTQCFMRAATPVYVGKGEGDARIQAATCQNITQARLFAAEQLGIEDGSTLKVHFSCLVTDSPKENQHLMIRHTYDATRRNPDNEDDVSYLPCNWDGTHRMLDLSPLVEHPPSIHSTPSNQAERYRRAAQVSNDIRGQENVIEMVGCASGMDRTETESEYASQEFIRSRYRAHGILVNVKGDEVADPVIMARDGDVIEQTRAKSRNSAEINAHLVGGSRGCKDDSRGKTFLINYDNLFSTKTDKAMYLASAKTNKVNEVDKEEVKAILSTQSTLAEENYTKALNTLEAAISQAPQNLKEPAQAVRDEIVAVKGRIKPSDLGTLTRFTLQAATVAKGPLTKSDANPEPQLAYAGEVSRLGAISKSFNKKSKWKILGYAALVLCGVALVAAGLLFSIPSGGSSLLAAALGAKAIAFVVGTSAKVAVTAAHATLGVSHAAGVSVATGVVGLGVAAGGVKGVKSQLRHGIEKEHRFFSAVNRLKESAEEKAEKKAEKKDQSPRRDIK